MEILNEVQERISSFSGIKSSLPQGVLDATDAEDIRNFVTRRGRLRKMWGLDLKFNSGSGAGPIQWASRLASRWLAQHGNAILKELSLGQYDFEQVGEILLGEANRAMSAKWENREFLSNGVENKFLEFTATRGWKYLNLGLLPPGGGEPHNEFLFFATSVVSANASSGLLDANYTYTMTYWDDVRQVESLPFNSAVGEDGLWFWADQNWPAIVIATGATGRQIALNIAAIKALGYDERVTHFIIYRRLQADTTAWKRVPLAGSSNTFITAIAENEFVDFAAEADLGSVLDLSISPPPSGKFYQDDSEAAPQTVLAPQSIGPRFVEQFRDQLWLFGVRFPGTRFGYDPEELRFIEYFPQTGILYASDVGNPDHWLYTFDIGKSTDQEDTGIRKFGNILMFFKSKSSYYLSGTSPENYEIRDLDPTRGFTVPSSVQSTTIGIIGIGEGGFTLFDGIGPGKLIADELFDYVKRINLGHADKIASAFDPLEEKYECSVPLDEFTYNSHVFSFDCKTRAWSVTRRVFGAAAYDLEGKVSVSLLGDPRNGRLYDGSNYASTTLNGQTMHGLWRSRAFDFGRPDRVKTVQVVEITARAKRDFRISIDLISDFGQDDTASEHDVDPDVRDDAFGASAQDAAAARWDSAQWSKGVTKKKFTILIQNVGKNFNLVIRNSDTDANEASFEIEEVLVRASMEDGENQK